MGNITTGSILAFAAILPIELAKGEHSLRVTVNAVSADTTFLLGDSLFVGVNYYSDPKIAFTLQRNPFPYR